MGVMYMIEIFKMWLGSVVLLSALSVVLGYVAIAPLETKPDRFKNQEGCYMSKFDKVVPLGKSIPSTDACVAYICHEDNVIIHGCGAVLVKPPFGLFEDKEKPYPDCCPQIKLRDN